MSRNIHFKFDANQEHQKRAIESVVELFDGFPHNKRQVRLLVDECTPNVEANDVFDEQILLGNLQEIQKNNALSVSPILNQDEGFKIPVQEKIGLWRYPSFTIEMETGTGKTYAYLRTMYELRQQFGFSKFIV